MILIFIHNFKPLYAYKYRVTSVTSESDELDQTVLENVLEVFH